MKKVILSISMLGEKINDVLENDIALLCNEKDVSFGNVMQDLVKTSDIPELNIILEEYFPGEIKLVD